MPALTGKSEKMAVGWLTVLEWVAESVGIFREFLAGKAKF
jgi:hypothetical protein